MRKFYTMLFTLFMGGALTALAQQPLPKVVDNGGHAIDMPVFNPNNQNFNLQRKCGTYLTQRREASAQGPKKSISTAYNYVPHTGTVNIPVILVNFQDVKFSVNEPKQAFEQFFNGTTQADLGNGNNVNYGSVQQYFSDMSGGRFKPQFSVYGPVTVSRNMRYYGGNSSDGNGDERPQQLVVDAIQALQNSSEAWKDASAFCSDGNAIDCVYIIYAGLGQNYGGADSTVWANTWTVSGSVLGKQLRWYSMAGELTPTQINGNPMIAGVGVTCHELSHALGLPDFYPAGGYNPASAQIDNQEMEMWDLMDGGEYVYSGFSPVAYTAFEKNEMGWPVDIRELDTDQQVTMNLSTEEGGAAYKISNPNNSRESIMLELVRLTGWNAHVYGNGLMAYHVNKPSAAISSNTRFNNTPRYPGMAIIPADGLVASSYGSYDNTTYYSQLRGDLFPGTGNNTTTYTTELNDSSNIPNFCWYNSNFSFTNSSSNQKLPTNKALRNIAYDVDSHTLSFNYIHDVTTGIRTINASSAKAHSVYSIGGTYLGTTLNGLPHGVYIVDGKKVVK